MRLVGSSETFLPIICYAADSRGSQLKNLYANAYGIIQQKKTCCFQFTFCFNETGYGRK